jgi:hypothetical protein
VRPTGATPEGQELRAAVGGGKILATAANLSGPVNRILSRRPEPWVRHLFTDLVIHSGELIMIIQILTTGLIVGFAAVVVYGHVLLFKAMFSGGGDHSNTA